jgi:thymidylate synthase (FAD)
MSVRLIWVTPNAEQIIAYCARVSNPGNQDNSDIKKLIHYCAKNGHWSIFEMASMCVEIETTRAISAQVLRHRSFSFQEFSQRYAEATEIDIQEGRRQDTKNRQNSTNDLREDDKKWFEYAQKQIHKDSKAYYKEALKRGIAKECARALLPLSTKTRLYMTGTVRSWIHYLQLRTGNGTQKEHMEIANDIKDIFDKEFPIIGGIKK